MKKAISSENIYDRHSFQFKLITIKISTICKLKLSVQTTLSTTQKKLTKKAKANNVTTEEILLKSVCVYDSHHNRACVKWDCLHSTRNEQAFHLVNVIRIRNE